MLSNVSVMRVRKGLRMSRACPVASLLKVVELETDGIGADSLEAVYDAGYLAVRNVAWGFDKDCYLNALSLGKIEAREHVVPVDVICESIIKDFPQFQTERRHIIDRSHISQGVEHQGSIRLDRNHECVRIRINIRSIMRRRRQFGLEAMRLEGRSDHEDDQKNEEDIDQWSNVDNRRRAFAFTHLHSSCEECRFRHATD